MALLLALGVAVGCGPTIVRETILEQEDLIVELRSVIPRGEEGPSYDHPVTISDVRVAHVLASLSHEDKDGRRRPTIRAQHVYPMAEAIAKAIAKATPKDEVAAAAFWKEKRLLVFSAEHVTALRAYFQEPFLVIEFFNIDDRLEKTPRAQAGDANNYRIPLEAKDWSPGFTVVAGKAQTLVGNRKVEVEWRDPFYAKPVSVRPGSGRIKRRTILFDTEEESEGEEEAGAVGTAAEKLSDAQTRALDQLEGARRAGLVTESEYRRRRYLVLEGRLEEAGYDTEP